MLRRVFECVVETCIETGLVDGVSFSLDACHIRADVNQVKRVPGDQADALPERQRASHALREYLDGLDREDAEEGKRRTKPPKALSLTDPQAAWMTKRNTRAFFAYDANYLIDNKLGVIVDAEGTRANRIDENRAAIAMVERVAERFDLRPNRLAADTAYGSGKTLRSLTDRGIEPHIPVWDKSTRNDGTFSRRLRL